MLIRTWPCPADAGGPAPYDIAQVGSAVWLVRHASSPHTLAVCRSPLHAEWVCPRLLGAQQDGHWCPVCARLRRAVHRDSATDLLGAWQTEIIPCQRHTLRGTLVSP